VAFAPAARGSQEAFLAFNLRDETFGVPLTGVGVVAEIALDIRDLDFGERLSGDAAEGTVQVSNTGDVDVEITDVRIAGGAGSAFSLVGGGETGPLPVGAVRDVQVRFAPSQPGAYLDSLRIATVPGGETFVRLRGVGLGLGYTVTLPDTAVAGTPLTVAIRTLDLFNPTARDLFYRRGGEQAYQQVTLDATGGAPLGIQSADSVTYTGVIPGDFITERGFDYYVRLSDGQRTLTFPDQSPVERPAHERVWIEARTAAGASVPGAYRMISVPVVLADPAIPSVLVDDFGAYAPDRWRLIRWQPEQEVYQEYTFGLEDGFTPGAAFWLITAAGGTYDVEAGWSVDASGPFSVVLPPGWSQVGHPFAFPVAWDGVGADGLVDPPVAYDGEYQYDQPLLQPWEGYFIYNAEPVPVILSIPARAGALVAGKHASSGSSAAGAGYTVRLVAELPDAGLQDTRNVLGLAAEAAEGRDALDRAEAPPLSPYVRLSSLEGDERLAVNMKPLHGEGQRWDLAVTAQTADRLHRKEVVIRLVEQGPRPDGAALYVFDLDLDTPVPLAANAFTVVLTDDEPVRRLRLIIGTAAFAEQHSDAIPLTPAADLLAQNYPNPFTQETRITYQMSRRSRARLEVYDALGRRVCTLVDTEQAAGEHVVVWDGRDEAGRAVANGLYFYRLQAGSFSATQAMTVLRN
jgi:hypothetical protein